MKKSKILSIVFIVIYLALLSYFVIMGLEDSKKSTETSGVVVEVVTEVIESVTPPDYVVNEEKVAFLTRKIVGHFGYNVLMGIFLLLACLCFFIVKIDYNKYFKYLIKCFLLTFVTTLVIAIVSELIQLIPSGRSCEVKDMLIDFSGGVLGLVLSSLGFLIYCKTKNKKESENNGQQ